MEKYEMSAIDAYINRAYKTIIILPLTGATTSAVVFTIYKILGWWPSVQVLPLILYDIINVFYVLCAVYLYRTCMDEDGIIKTSKIRQAKLFVGCLVVAQWNCITYMFPDREWWAYLFFFIGLTIVFFDVKLTAVISAALILSTFLSWIIRPEIQFLSMDDPYFWPTFILRLFCIGLSTATLLFITYFGGKYLVEELEKNANYDTLTHLLNRRTLDEHLSRTVQTANTGGGTFCLLMFDIDDFKHVNDSYGHDCGDAVLKAVAHIIATGVKKDDYVFRWGGEEILVLLMANLEQAENAAERIRRDIERDPIVYKDDISVPVTVTIGVSGYEPGMTTQAMMESADEKLYYGKRHGKNQTVVKLPENLAANLTMTAQILR